MEKARNDRGNGVGKLAGGDMASESQGNRMVVGRANGKVASHATSQAKWTFMVYMAGDNNLDGAALRDIAEMARAGSTKDVHNEAVYRTLIPGIEIHEGIILETGLREGDGEAFGEAAIGDGRGGALASGIGKWAGIAAPPGPRENGAPSPTYRPIPKPGAILLIHGHQADPKCSGEIAAVSRFFVHNFWPDLQRCGVRDPTRAALNPGLCNEVDKRLHEWANRNDQGVTAIIAGHTHRAVFENLSLTERRYMESKVKTDSVKIKNQPDGSYYNTGSCVHQLCITGIEITFENGPRLRLIKWGQATEGYALTIQRTVLEET